MKKDQTKKLQKRLALNTETLRVLDDKELADVNGGAAQASIGSWSVSVSWNGNCCGCNCGEQ